MRVAACNSRVVQIIFVSAPSKIASFADADSIHGEIMLLISVAITQLLCDSTALRACKPGALFPRSLIFYFIDCLFEIRHRGADTPQLP